MLLVRSRRATIFAALGAVVALNATSAQASARKGASDVSRAGLEARARAADSLHRKEEAFVLHTRLKNGDFEIGDRIGVSYEGLGLHGDTTLVVQTGKIIGLGEPMGDLNLNGILRFELRDSIIDRVAEYYRNEVVHVTPLLRLTISGAVRAPGTYYARPDLPLSDVVTRAGGLDPSADLANVVIMRGDQVRWTMDDVQSAVSEGLTLERLGLEPGDEIVVGARSWNHWASILQIGIPAFLAILIPTLIHRR